MWRSFFVCGASIFAGRAIWTVSMGALKSAPVMNKK